MSLFSTKKPLHIFSILATISLVFLTFKMRLHTALADAAPPVPPQGSDLSPAIGTTRVRMVSEYVLIDIAGYSTDISGHANVTAQFLFHNQGEVTEQMKVRFPLNHTEYDLEYELEYHEEVCPDSLMSPLRELRVWVDGVEVNTEITYKRMFDYAASPNYFQPVYTDGPCWAHFDVTFPPGQDVALKVSYIASGYSYMDNGAGEVEFSYVLGTGAGWDGTIGKADIVARFPYDVNEANAYGCIPEDCTFSGKEVSWHFKDFEPEENIRLRVIRPMIWMRILEERENVKANPDEGEAWGLLGKAYKEAVTSGKGMIGLWSDREKELFHLSVEAYQNAINLLPEDADWHYGFADLLCNRAMWSGGTYENWHSCLLEIKTALDLEPMHEGANKLLENLNYWQEFAYFERELVDLSGDQPVYLLLSHTPEPTATDPPPTLTRTRLVKTNTPTSEVTATATKTLTLTPESQQTPTPSNTLPLTETATTTQAIAETTTPKSTGFIYFGAFLVLFLGIYVLLRWRRG